MMDKTPAQAAYEFYFNYSSGGKSTLDPAELKKEWEIVVSCGLSPLWAGIADAAVKCHMDSLRARAAACLNETPEPKFGPKANIMDITRGVCGG